MLSVIVPTNVCGFVCAEGSDVSASTAITRPAALYPAAICDLPPATCYLFARRHQVRGRRPRIHDPHAAASPVFRQPHGCLRGAGHGDRHVRARHILARTHQVLPDGTTRGLDAHAALVE